VERQRKFERLVVSQSTESGNVVERRIGYDKTPTDHQQYR
jgi:hypothetical protein